MAENINPKDALPVNTTPEQKEDLKASNETDIKEAGQLSNDQVIKIFNKIEDNFYQSFAKLARDNKKQPIEYARDSKEWLEIKNKMYKSIFGDNYTGKTIEEIINVPAQKDKIDTVLELSAKIDEIIKADIIKGISKDPRNYLKNLPFVDINVETKPFFIDFNAILKDFNQGKNMDAVVNQMQSNLVEGHEDNWIISFMKIVPIMGPITRLADPEYKESKEVFQNLSQIRVKSEPDKVEKILKEDIMRKDKPAKGFLELHNTINNDEAKYKGLVENYQSLKLKVPYMKDKLNNPSVKWKDGEKEELQKNIEFVEKMEPMVDTIEFFLRIPAYKMAQISNILEKQMDEKTANEVWNLVWDILKVSLWTVGGVTGVYEKIKDLPVWQEIGAKSQEVYEWMKNTWTGFTEWWNSPLAQTNGGALLRDIVIGLGSVGLYSLLQQFGKKDISELSADQLKELEKKAPELIKKLISNQIAGIKYLIFGDKNFDLKNADPTKKARYEREIQKMLGEFKSFEKSITTSDQEGIAKVVGLDAKKVFNLCFETLQTETGVKYVEVPETKQKSPENYEITPKEFDEKSGVIIEDAMDTLWNNYSNIMGVDAYKKFISNHELPKYEKAIKENDTKTQKEILEKYEFYRVSKEAFGREIVATMLEATGNKFNRVVGKIKIAEKDYDVYFGQRVEGGKVVKDAGIDTKEYWTNKYTTITNDQKLEKNWTNLNKSFDSVQKLITERAMYMDTAKTKQISPSGMDKNKITPYEVDAIKTQEQLENKEKVKTGVKQIADNLVNTDISTLFGKNKDSIPNNPDKNFLQNAWEGTLEFVTLRAKESDPKSTFEKISTYRKNAQTKELNEFMKNNGNSLETLYKYFQDTNNKKVFQDKINTFNKIKQAVDTLSSYNPNNGSMNKVDAAKQMLVANGNPTDKDLLNNLTQESYESMVGEMDTMEKFVNMKPYEFAALKKEADDGRFWEGLSAVGKAAMFGAEQYLNVVGFAGQTTVGNQEWHGPYKFLSDIFAGKYESLSLAYTDKPRFMLSTFKDFGKGVTDWWDSSFTSTNGSELLTGTIIAGGMLLTAWGFDSWNKANSASSDFNNIDQQLGNMISTTKDKYIGQLDGIIPKIRDIYSNKEMQDKTGITVDMALDNYKNDIFKSMDENIKIIDSSKVGDDVKAKAKETLNAWRKEVEQKIENGKKPPLITSGYTGYSEG